MRVTSELAIEITGKKKRCSIRLPTLNAATASSLFKIRLNIKAPIAIIIIDRDEGIPILRISLIIFGLNFRYFREKLM
jgi:hypothetical protein